MVIAGSQKTLKLKCLHNSIIYKDLNQILQVVKLLKSKEKKMLSHQHILK